MLLAHEGRYQLCYEVKWLLIIRIKEFFVNLDEVSVITDDTDINLKHRWN